MSELPDQGHRDRIRTDTASTLFVNAGAGSGKTSALVDRIVTLVLEDGLPLADLVAVTFTERAGAELRDRLRAVLELRWRVDGPDRGQAAAALDDLDRAAIGTLHGFARRVLSEYAIEAGLPPLIEVVDEIGSSIAFDERWSELQSQLLDADQMAKPLLLGMALGVQLKHLRTLALTLGRDWDLIGERILIEPAPRVVVPDLTRTTMAALDLLDQRRFCIDPEDRLLIKLEAIAQHLESFQLAADDETRIAEMKALGDMTIGKVGRAGNWTRPIQEIRALAGALVDEAKIVTDDLLNRCLRALTCWLAERVLDSAQIRRREGQLEFHDLLVLTRDLLRGNADVRQALSEEYQRLLLDEFQDTDPIQIELAARICGGRDADAPRWQDIAIPPGRLFVVGDAKQSIYRFRRASIATYLDAQSEIGEAAELTTNFRTVADVLDWVNVVFGRMIISSPGGQPDYVPLDVARTSAGHGPAVTTLGAQPHADEPKAGPLRQREAADVAAVINKMLAEEWTVQDRADGQWRPVHRSDIAVLVPARTSLPFLEDAFDAAGITYRAEASSLVYQSSDVRSLLATARAIADASDALALVTALRSPLFGCGDDDLWRWRQEGARFSLHATADGRLADGPVGQAIDYLRRLSYTGRWQTPSELLTTIAVDRRMFEVAATGRHARDSWRRLRFVIDHARAWSETTQGGLRSYLAWAALQGQEVSRVAEAILPETDLDAVQVMTVHAAKGLEFPVVIMSGMTSQSRKPFGVNVLWSTEGGYQVRLGRQLQTEDFATALPVDEQMDDYERRRLLYVAATRARDHLVVSLHRSSKQKPTAAQILADAGAVESAGAVPFDADDQAPVAVATPLPIAPPPPWEDWQPRILAAREQSRTSRVITASGLEGTEPEVVLAETQEPGLAKGARDLELPPWSKGRYGSAIGRAVHAVLQVVDLETGSGLAEAVQSQSVAEGTVGQEDLIAALANAALASPIVGRAAERQHWRETYVGTRRPDGTLLEGYIDLAYREDDGSLVIIDYKTDAIPAGAISSRVAYYRPQLEAYRDALAAATGADISAWLLFLHPEQAIEQKIGPA